MHDTQQYKHTCAVSKIAQCEAVFTFELVPSVPLLVHEVDVQSFLVAVTDGFDKAVCELPEVSFFGHIVQPRASFDMVDNIVGVVFVEDFYCFGFAVGIADTEIFVSAGTVLLVVYTITHI